MFAFYVGVFAVCVSSTLATITTVQTEYGAVWSDETQTTRRGTTFSAFRGIPYAAPPVGPLRFEPPHRHEKWHEPRNATAFGAACFQNQGRNLPYDLSEDCLFINVFTPNVEPKKLLPVLVYIHGGAFQFGTGNMFAADNFMDSPPIVMVTFNYRLGVFGYLSSGDDSIPGNYALKDQVAALKWVQTNIRHFGGDPKNVTLMGQSSGAHNTHAHTLSHASEGLFHRAIILSGSTLSMWGYYPPQSHEAHHTYTLFVEQANCKRDTAEATVECLRGLDSSTLKRAESHFLTNHSIPFIFRMVIEPAKTPHAFMTNDPRELNYPNPKIPIVVGVCSAEGSMNALMFFGAHRNEKEVSKALDDFLPSSLHYKYWLKTDQVPHFTEKLKQFFFENPHYITASDFPSLSKLFGKILFQLPAVDMAISYPGKVYAYFYDYVNTNSPWTHGPHVSSLNITGAGHGDDLISIFESQDPRRPQLSSADQKVADQLVAYLKSFIYTGNPNNKIAQLPKWNAVYSKKVEYLHITKDGCVPSSGWAEDPNYTFYRSLPIPWHKMPNDVAGGATKISNHEKRRLAKHRRPKSEHEHKTHHEPFHNRFNSTMDLIMYLWRFV